MAFGGFLKTHEEGPKQGEIEWMARKDSFSKFLPWVAYEKSDDVYLLHDNTFAVMYECSPLAFLGSKASSSLAGMLGQDFPPETVISFTLYSDDHVEDTLAQYRKLKTRDDPIIREAAARYSAYLDSGRAGFKAMSGIRLRNFRLFVCIKSPKMLTEDKRAQVTEALKAAGMGPRTFKPDSLIEVMRRLFNRKPPERARSYCDSTYIRNQIILAENTVRPKDDIVWLGSVPAACMTPKVLTDIGSLDVNALMGGFMGIEDDDSQLNCRVLWTTNVYFQANTGKIKRKADILNMQRAGGSIAKTIGRRVGEMNWVLDDLENKRYCNVITSMWILGDDEDHLASSIARAQRLWENKNFVMQRESKIAVPLLIASLPGGLYLGKPAFRNTETMDRDFQVSVTAAAHLLPVQADFAGGMRPVLCYVGRKGQLVTVDVFDPGANNHNFLVCAGSGAGKSFSLNFLASNYYGMGAKLRLVDIGYSYQKQAALVGGRFIDIGDPSLKIVINPFATVSVGDAEDAAANRGAVAQVLLAMVYSNTGTASVTETQVTLMKYAVEFALKRDGGEYGIDHVIEYLAQYPQHAEVKLDQLIPLAKEMAFNLHDFSSKGRYGRMFNGKSTFNIGSDDFVVLEMERLLTDPELFGVVSLQVLNAITSDLYLSDRGSRRFMMFDEAWKYLIQTGGAQGSAGNSATSAIAGIIEEGYRRARKYGGATGIVTQSPLDLGKMGPAGEVIRANSAFKFWLQNDPEEWSAAAKRDIVNYSGLKYDLAVSIKNAKPRYSEIFFDTPFGSGCGRLAVDPWTYWVNTSSPDEYKIVTDKARELGSYKAALDALASRK